MCKMNKFADIIDRKDLFAFHKLINKEGIKFYEYITFTFEENQFSDNMYFLLIYNLWSTNTSKTRRYDKFSNYILDNFSVLASKAQVLALEEINDFPSFNDRSIKKSVRTKRKINYMNERIINHILIDSFKKEVKLKDCFYDVVINTVGIKNTEIRDLTGNIYSKFRDSHCCYYVFLVTINKIYIKNLNLNYNLVDKNISFKSFNFDDIKFITLSGPKNYDLLSKFMILTNKNFDDIIIPKSKYLAVKNLKKALLLLLDSKGLAIQDLSTKSKVLNIL